MALYLGSAGVNRKACHRLFCVMAGLVPAIHVLLADSPADVDTRDI